MPKTDYTHILDNLNDPTKLLEILKNHYPRIHEKLICFTINTRSPLKKFVPYKDPYSCFPQTLKDVLDKKYPAWTAASVPRWSVGALIEEYYDYIYR